MAALYSRNGKQVFIAGAHFGDGINEEAAEAIVRALNGEFAKASSLYAAGEALANVADNKMATIRETVDAVRVMRAALASVRGDA